MENAIEILKKSGLRGKGELNVLLGVSYPMAFKYMKGSIPRTPERRKFFNETIKVLAALLEQGKLPLADDMDAESRLKVVEKIRAFVQSAVQQ